MIVQCVCNHISDSILHVIDNPKQRYQKMRDYDELVENLLLDDNMNMYAFSINTQ